MCRSPFTLLYLYMLLPWAALGYFPEEMECPDNVEKDFFFAHPWVPPGTPLRTMLTLPPGFEVRMSGLPGRGMGVYTRTFVQAHTWLSEYEGEYVPIEEAEDMDTFDYAWRVQQDGYDDRLIDARDESLGNWLRYVNCGGHVSQENVEMTMCYGRIYFKTTKNVPPGTELLMYCGDEYVSEYLDFDRDTYFNSSSRNGTND